MKTLRSLLCLPVLLAVSCGAGKDDAPPPAHKSFSQRLDENNGYKVDEKGNWVAKNDKRSSFESVGESPNVRGKYGTKEYKVGDFKKKSWWGNKDYGSPQYAGNTDGSRFQQQSRLSNESASEGGTAATLTDNYKTGAYATSAAHESGSSIAKSYNVEAENRREDFPNWAERRTLTVEQSRGILGR